MRDITIGDTFSFHFTTRAFATGIPTTLAGTPVLSVHEEGNDTFITAGVTLDVDIGTSPVTGLHEGTVVATVGNGYESGKTYGVYISTGTVDGVSVVGELVHEFTIEKSAAAVDLANATDGLGALKTLIDDVPTVSEFNARTLVAASYFDPAADTVANVTTVATTTDLTNLPSIPANWLTAAGIAAFALDGKGDWNVGKTGYSLTQAFPANFASLVITAGGAVDSLVQGVLNTLVTETNAGDVANNFTQFFDVNPTSTQTINDVGAGAGGSFWSTGEQQEIRQALGITGTKSATSGGNLDDVLADTADMQPKLGTFTTDLSDDLEGFFQIITRSDVAIGTDRGALVTRINADEGSGAGDWSLTTESLEATRKTIEADTNELQSDWADGGRLDLLIDAIVADTNELQTDDVPGLIAALNDLSTAEVLTQVNSALDTAIAELGVAAPTATPTVRTGLMLLYMMARNKLVVQTSGTDALEIYNDAGTKIASKLLTDVGGDYTEEQAS